MTKLIKSTDFESGQTEYVLKLSGSDTEKLKEDTACVLKMTESFLIDVTDADTLHSVSDSIPSACPRIKVIIRHESCDTETLKSLKRVSDIDVSDTHFILSLGSEENPDIYDVFKVMQINIQNKKRTMEAEILGNALEKDSGSSLETEHLKRENERLQALLASSEAMDHSERYVALMEKYKQALTRLNHLRNSKLGRLQMAYWKRRGRQ